MPCQSPASLAELSIQDALWPHEFTMQGVKTKGKGFSPRGWYRLPREEVTSPGLSEFKRHFDSQAHVVTLGVSCAESGAGLDDPDGSLLTQHNL